jgi:hypothetical protein
MTSNGTWIYAASDDPLVIFFTSLRNTDANKPRCEVYGGRACSRAGFLGRFLPGAVDYLGIAGLAIDQQDLELLVIALREKDVAAKLPAAIWALVRLSIAP